MLQDLRATMINTMHNYMWFHAFSAPILAYGQPGILAHLLSSKLTADKQSFDPKHRAAVILASWILTAMLTQDADLMLSISAARRFHNAYI